MAISKLKVGIVKKRALQLYGTDLTKMAEKGKLDPVIGRDKEIEQLTEALLNRRKSNACLVGEAGVGKTAIVEGLAIQIAQGSAPPKLIGKRVISLNLNNMYAGTTLIGMFEERIRDVLKEVQQSEGSVILFIDELHAIMRSTHKNNTADILKPALARGDFMCIGATTLEEYTTSIENDAALKRRFQTIHVLEPSRDASIEILKELVPKYQIYHRVNYTNMALVAAVDLSIHYIRELFLPDKAIDLIDEAGARAQLLGETYVTEADIEHVVSTCTGIPVNKVSTKESERLLHLEDKLKRSLIGQDEAVAAVCRALCRARVGLRDETKPIGCFLFTGPTGVGKTEMAKVLAREYFGSEEAMVRLDMSEFMDQHSVTRLIGSSPGYSSHSKGGQLTEAVRRRRHSLVLFDEIEKAHAEILNLLLQILDDGRLSDGKGKTVDFTNTIVIVTSNVGSNSLELKDDSKQRVFKAELLNRFDRVVVFEPLKKEHIENILEIFIEKLRASVAAKKKIHVDVSERLKARLVSEGYDERYGARALKRVVTSLVEDKLAEEVLNGTVARYDTIMMDVSLTGEVVCQTVSQVKIGPTCLNSDSDTSKHSKLRIVRSCCVFGGHEFGCQPTNLDVSDGIAQVFDCI